MKKLVIVILLLSPAALFAQGTRLINRVDEQQSLINRIDVQSGEYIQKTGRIQHSIDPHPLLMQGSQKTFTISLRDTVVQVPAGKAIELQGTMTNLTSFSVKIIFERTHIKIDTNLSAGICDLCNCYSASKDSLPSTQACPLPPGTSLQKFSYSPLTVDLTQSDTLVDYIKLTALSGDPGDTVSFTIKTIFTPQNAVQTQQRQNTSSPSITAIYPSPLVQGSSIKVKVSSPRDCSFSYSIYDAIGRVVGFGSTRQHINLGDNTIDISSLEGLSNGGYMLKLNFGDGSSDSHFFQVVR